jgi:hypothetical protein
MSQPFHKYLIPDLTNLILDYRYDFSYEKQEVIQELKFKFKPISCDDYWADELLSGAGPISWGAFKDGSVAYFFTSRFRYQNGFGNYCEIAEETYNYQKYKQKQEQEEQQHSKRARV